MARSENEIVREVMDKVRDLLDRRLDDIESGRVKPLTPEQLQDNLGRRKKDFFQRRS